MKNVIIKLFKSFNSKEKKFFFFIFFLMFCGMLLEAFSIGLIFPLITFMLDNNSNSDQVSTLEYFKNITNLNYLINFLSLKIIMIIIVFVFLVKNIFLIFQTYMQAKFTSYLGMMKSHLLYKKYVLMPYSFHVRNNSGYLLRNITEEIGNYCGAVIVLIRLITEALVLLGIGILLLLISPFITIIIFFVFIFIMFIFQNITKPFFLKWGEQKQKFTGERIINLQQTFGALKELKILNRFNKFYDEFKFKNDILYKINIKNETLVGSPKFLIEFILIVLISFIIIYFSYSDNTKAAIPLLGLLAAASFRVMPSINRILNYIHELRYFNASLDLLTKEILSVENNDIMIKQNIKTLPFNNKVNFKNVAFSHKKNNKNIFDEVNLDIKFGEIIGIFGDSGSGKTTFLDLLIGLYKPDSGTIKVDGEDIHKSHLNWSKNIGYVSQDVYLTDDTIKNNIALGVYENKINDEKITNSIKNSGLEDYIDSLSLGIDTNVGEKGTSISGGQKQRIGIARALYNNPKILVLDEATSSLDEENEKNILDFIFKLKDKITIIIVSHKKKNLYECDRVFKIDNGKLKSISF